MLNEDTRLLLARCRRGDAEAQSELLRAIQPRLYFYCLKMLKDERRAQDTERKIFCEVLNGLSELKNDEDFPLRTVSTAARLCRAAARNAAPDPGRGVLLCVKDMAKLKTIRVSYCIARVKLL